MGALWGIGNLVHYSAVGQAVYHLSGRHWCRPITERPGYVIPEKYLGTVDSSISRSSNADEKEKQDQDGSSTNSSISNSYIIVDWDGPDDPENPLNWSYPQKFLISIILSLATTSLYSGSAIFTPAEEQMLEDWGIARVKLMLGLALFVWGYGLGSLWFAPMSENPLFGGRNYIYLACQLIYSVLQIPTALCNHIAPFAVLRVLAGICAAPMLSTAPASYADMIPFPSLVYAIITWSMGAIMGPYIAPLIGAALVQHNPWRWAFWFLLIAGVGILLVELLFLPETSEQALLMRRASSLRRITGNDRIMAPGDIKLRHQNWGEVLKYIFWKPIELTIYEPILLFINLHLTLAYSIIYLYFEAFPFYATVNGFNLVQMGLSYMSLLVGVVVTTVLYVPYLHTQLIRPVLRNLGFSPERVFGEAAILGSVMMPVGIFIFGWTTTASVHWVVPLVGNLFLSGGIFLLFQSYMSFLGAMYPAATAGSAFASDGIARSMAAGAFPLFGSVMYEHTSTRRFPIGWGCSIVAFAAVGLIGLPVFIRLRGRQLREKAQIKYGQN